MSDQSYVSDMHMPLNVYYKELDWPILPDDLCQRLIDHVPEAERADFWFGKDFYQGYEQRAISQEAQQWLKDNIPIDLTGFEMRLQVMTDSHVPMHRDIQRASSFNFVLTDDNSITNWHGANSKIIHSVCYKRKCWYHHQSQVVHSVENITPPRIAITIFKLEIQNWLTDHRKTHILKSIKSLRK